MKNTFMVIPLVFLFCLIVGCQQGERVLVEQKPDVEADIQAIRDRVAELSAAIKAADIDRVMSLFADNAVRIPPNEPAQSGKEAIRNDFQQIFDEYTLQEDGVVADVNVSGDLAVIHLTYSGIATPKAGGESGKYHGNWIIIFEKKSDDTWKVIYSIWSDETLVYPDQAE